MCGHFSSWGISPICLLAHFACPFLILNSEIDATHSVAMHSVHRNRSLVITLWAKAICVAFPMYLRGHFHLVIADSCDKQVSMLAGTTSKKPRML